MDWTQLETCEYDCPHCGATWAMRVKDALYVDNVSDDCETKCTECGGLYQLRCVSVEVEMEAIAKDPNIYGSNAGIRCDTDSGPCACGAWH